MQIYSDIILPKVGSERVDDEDEMMKILWKMSILIDD
jgi:hypothetical protein